MKIYGKRAVTLIELMIVLAVVGLLAAIVIPQYGNMLEKANLGATMGNLAALRSAFNIYYSQYTVTPDSIDPAVEPQFAVVLDGEVPWVKAKYPQSNAPYGNLVTTSKNHGQIPSTMGTGWFYNSQDGLIFINSTADDINGNSYTTY